MQSISDFMEKDHDRLDGLFNQYKDLKNSNQNKAKEIFSGLKSGLENHIMWEEEILFPLFEQKTGMFNGGPTAVMRMEHTSIKNFLNAISAKLTVGSIQTDNLDSNLVSILSEHNNKEENILYPMIDRLLIDEEMNNFFVKIKNI